MGGIDGALMEGVMANLSSVLQQAAADHGKRPAVRMDGLVLSYFQLWNAARRLTSLLASLKIVPGDRVALMLRNVPAFPIAFYGALGAGAMVVPVNPLLKSREVAHCLGDSGARVLFAWHSVAGEAGKGAAETGTQVVAVAGPDLSACGFNVYPREVEEVLYEHPAVAEAAVIGVPHDALGEEVGAAVALKPGATATPADLRAFAREQMAPYKYPRYVWLVPGLPKGPTGKILRREVHPPEEF